MEMNQTVSNDQEQQIRQEPQKNDATQQNNPISQINSQTISAQNLSPSEDPIDEEEGQINQQENKNQEQADQNPPQSHESINKDTYINKLQSYLNKVKMDFTQKSKDFQDLNEDNKKTKQTLKKVRFDFLSSKQQISTLTQQKLDLQKEVENLKQLNEQLNKEISVFKEAGDVNMFKQKITELEKLLQIQKQELQIKSAMIDERDEIATQNHQFTNKIQIFNLIEQYQTKNKDLEMHLQKIQIKNQISQKQLGQSLLRNQKLQQMNSCHEQSLRSYQLKICELEDGLRKKEEELMGRLKQSEESLMQMMQSQQINKDLQQEIERKPCMLNPQQKYGIRMLTPVEQRDLILKEFIELEVKYLSTTQQLTSLRQRHYHTIRQIKNLSTTHISKKDYSQLYKKYTKLRNCLENSLLTEQSLRNQLKHYAASTQILTHNISQSQQQITTNLESRYRSIILEEPENAINQVQKIIEKSSELHHQFFTLKQQLQTKQKLIKIEKILKQKQQQILNLQQQLQTKNNIALLYDSELTFKNNQIQLLRTAHHQNLHQINQLQNNTIEKTQQNRLLSLIQQSKINLEILEIKNIQSIKENTTLKNQKYLLTELYNNLKVMYEQLLHKEPQSQKVDNSIGNQYKQSNPLIEKFHPCKDCLERQQKDKQVQFSQSEVQTEGLTDLYFKEIKSLLTIMKKFPQKVDDITGKLDSQKATINQTKKKFEQVTEAYAAKYRQLDEERKANEQWRVKQREQIREEFQQIRELLINERLTTALKKAKSLIEYYEQNAPQAQEEGNVEEGEQEGNEKNEGEEAIEQEEQNC